MADMQFRVPGDLEPSAGIVLRAVHIGRNQETLILSEDLGSPVAVDRKGAIHKAICNGSATWQEARPAFILTVAGFEPGSG